jgi:hypothetical protein
VLLVAADTGSQDKAGLVIVHHNPKKKELHNDQSTNIHQPLNHFPLRKQNSKCPWPGSANLTKIVRLRKA